jgi:hypothetical protein
MAPAKSAAIAWPGLAKRNPSITHPPKRPEPKPIFKTILGMRSEVMDASAQTAPPEHEGISFGSEHLAV